MKRNLWIGLATVLIGCFGGYTYHMMTDRPTTLIAVRTTTVPVKNDGDGESSDTIEPLVVEGGGDSVLVERMPEGDVQPMQRVMMTTGMRQPARPDAESAVRMPYADEEESWLGLALDPVRRLLESTMPRLNLFDEAEESENREVTPEPPMMPDYHQQHCPRHGSYPYNGR